MNTTTCPACGDPNACKVNGRIECSYRGCALYSAKWAALIKPGGDEFYVPPQIGSGRFAAIAADLSPQPEKPKPAPEPAPAADRPVLAPQLRRVVLAKKARSILLESPGTPRMLWVSQEIEMFSNFGTQSIQANVVSPVLPGVYDLVAFSGADLEFLTIDCFEVTRDRSGVGYREILPYNQPLQFFTEPTACATKVVQEYRGEPTVYLSLKVNAPDGRKPRFRVMFWGRPPSLDRSDRDFSIGRTRNMDRLR